MTSSAPQPTTPAPIKIVHTASGSSTTVDPFGATVTSYVTPSGYEALFVSRLARHDGSKAIRGGIPLVFPIFGPPPPGDGDCSGMPQHGFLRCNYWSQVGEMWDREDCAGCELALELGDATGARGDGAWSSNGGDKDCRLSLRVEVGAESMTTRLTIQNTGKVDISGYQTLFHTYLRVHGAKASVDSDACNVAGLDGYAVDDKITGAKYVLDGKGDQKPIISMDDQEVDRIYTPPPGKPTVDVVVCTGGNGEKVRLTASAQADGDGQENPMVSAVVWNPHVQKAKGMGDYGDEEYNEMVCVEPGILSGEGRCLKPGGEVVFTQVLMVNCKNDNVRT